MIKRRLIATLLVDKGDIVQTRKFRRTNMVGSAFTAVEFFNAWSVDEIIVVEISSTPDRVEEFVEIVDGLSRRCFVPLSVGGKIRDLDLVHRYMRSGADKVVVNTGAVRDKDLISAIARHYGSQCIVLSIDAARDSDMPSGYRVMIDNGREPTALDARAWAACAVESGAGEIMLNNVDHDGDKRGYDLELIRLITQAVSAPVIAMGGVGSWNHLVEGIEAGADAVAAGNIFHYTEHSTRKAKGHLAGAGLNVRKSGFYKVNMPRRPSYKAFKRASRTN
jgi:imidazole glycerol-phosphate synthase subunit HisF